MFALGALASCEARGSASPLAPAAVLAPLVVPSELAPALALIDSDERRAPFLDDTAGAWFRRHVRGVQIDASLPSNIRAQCCGPDRIIHWSTGWFPDPDNPGDVRAAAAILIHEARHAQGFPHSCPDHRRDRTYDEGGAWAVHSAWLRHMGDQATAESIATYDIGCH